MEHCNNLCPRDDTDPFLEGRFGRRNPMRPVRNGRKRVLGLHPAEPTLSVKDAYTS